MIMTSQHSQPHLQPISESQCKENETEKSNSIMDDAEILKIELENNGSECCCPCCSCLRGTCFGDFFEDIYTIFITCCDVFGGATCCKIKK